LILGFDKNRPVHIVVAFNQGTCIVITVYEPDTLVWTNDFKNKNGKFMGIGGNFGKTGGR